MRLLIQTDKRYYITDVSSVYYERDTDTLVAQDAENTYNVVIVEHKAFEYFNPMLQEGYVDLSSFHCTVTPNKPTGTPESITPKSE